MIVNSKHHCQEYRKSLPVGSANEYQRVHHVARKRIEMKCGACGSTSKIHASLKHDAGESNLRLDPVTRCIYSIDHQDYQPLCVGCHRVLDFRASKTHCKNGHLLTAETTSIKRDGSRRCLICHRTNNRELLKAPEARMKKIKRDRAYRESHPVTAEMKRRKLELQRARRREAAIQKKNQPISKHLNYRAI